MSRNKKLGAPEDIFDVPGNKAGVSKDAESLK
jgi:hypothetical protein